MESGGGPQQGGSGGHGRNTAASASPASPFTALSAFGQQWQRQPFQQQFLRRPEGNDAYLAYQAGNVHGVTGGLNLASSSGSMQLPRNFIDLGQHQVSPDIPEQNHNRNQGAEQQMMNPTQQAYLQYANQQKSTMGMQFPQQQQQMIPRIFGSLGKDQEMQMKNLRMQELISMQASNQSQSQSQADYVPDHRTNLRLNHPTLLGQAMSSQMLAPQSQQNLMNATNKPMSAAAQIHANMVAQQKTNENSGNIQSTSFGKLHVTSAHVGNESYPHLNSSSDVSRHPGSSRARQTVFPSILCGNSSAPLVNNSGSVTTQHLSMHGGDNNQFPPRQLTLLGQGMSPWKMSGSLNHGVDGSHAKSSPRNSSTPLVNNPGSMATPQLFMHGGDNNQFPPRQFTLPGQGISPWNMSGSLNHGDDGSHAKSSPAILAGSQTQNARQLNRLPSQSASTSNVNDVGNPPASQGGLNTQMLRSHNGFSKEQLRALKAQILAYRRLKKGEGLPLELLQCIVPPPIDFQAQQVSTPHVTTDKDTSSGENEDEHAQHMYSSEKVLQTVKPPTAASNIKEGGPIDGRAGASTVSMQSLTTSVKDPIFTVPSGKEEQERLSGSGKPDQASELGNQKIPIRTDLTDRGKGIAPHPSVSDSMPAKKPIHAYSTSQPKDDGSTRNYHGPLFDFPVFTRKHETLGSSMSNNNNNLALAYDIKDLIGDEGADILKKKREEKIGTIDKIIAVNLERKRISPDLVVRLQIESKKLQLAECQARLRDEIDQHQRVIMDMPNRPYEKFLRLCQLQRQDLSKQAHANRRATREKQLKSVFQWRKKLLDAHWAMRDARMARNRVVRKYHERMLRDFSKNNDDDHNKRMEALKNNDVERYREMLLERQTNLPGEASERYAVLSSFLTETEEYLNKLGGKITAAKNQQEVEEAATAAAAVARAQGLSGKELRAATDCAREEAMIRNRFSEMDAPQDSSSVNKYYNLAHAVNERVIRQPSMLQAGTLREYQLVGLQWMLSLYNNKLNGILADEMGLGKTVQVMALIAYLMEFKGNYGPHLIIVPNAVLVNWKSELRNWLPSLSCIYYVGGKDQRAKLFSQEVLASKFNVLVTTYEFIMFDRSKLSKIDWKYIVIDEAQRMKDRKSKLACDLDRYRCQRRLLLTGTPLQNDLEELWSLLNLLLPDVFDNRRTFHDWFSPQFQKEAPSHSSEDDWLETEKKVIVIHRLHQILEPFMLRRRVEDVEGSLPPKVSIVLKCRMSSIQGAIYDWIKSTGTIRVDPEEEHRERQRNPNYQSKVYKPLKNKCMELRKACNHPFLNYPRFSGFPKDFLVRSCGKLWVLDRVLIKLHRTGHRVLLFSTMTKLLDIMEEYLHWRGLVFRRIDGTTKLEDRENAIVEFNRPNSECFIFLLSIRAAGRGLNLQSADTVVIYDPDPNPKNEEQAVARAHRIGQKREVKVIYMEAVVDKVSSHQKEDEFTSGGGLVDLDEEITGKDRYMDSIESLIRNNIQQYKIDMADEVINAGRFDQRTTHEERRLTLEALLHDDERYQEMVHDVPSLREVNRMIARSEAEVELFDRMDEEFDWGEYMTRYHEVPEWIRASTVEVDAAVASSSKKPPRNSLHVENIVADSAESEKRGRAKPNGKAPVYTEIDDVNRGFSEEEEDEFGSQKFGSLSALDSRLATGSKKLVDESEDGEMALEGGDVQILQPKIKRKRSIRVRPQPTTERLEEKRNAKSSHNVQTEKKESSIKSRQTLPSRKNAQGSIPPNDATERGKSLDSKAMKGPKSSGSKMSEVTQRKCQKIIGKLQRRVEKEGGEIIPLLTRLWGKMEHSTDNLNLRQIDLRLEKFEYSGVVDLVSDVQRLLKHSMQHYGFCYEVRSEAKKVHDLLFNILDIVFPEKNMREIRSSMSFSAPGVAAGSSSRQKPSDQGKRLKAPIDGGSNKLKSHTPQEKTSNKLASGELVNCKRMRKDGEKSSGGPLSPGGVMSKSAASASAGWSNHAKRMRTDLDRRRPGPGHM